ncbi:MAG: ribosomal-protein-alanine N-acetyltransferase [Lachnospiraceae bacterium]|nr:ribosomal-protein-alanine N-acetyltransferase [Lachnospiraceae bacterium]
MVIRRMEERDLSSVVEIENDTFSDPWSYESFRKEAALVNNIYLVVEKEGQIVGYCGLWGIAGEGQITNVAVKQTCRNQRIGEKMMEALLDEGRKAGLTAFTLEVRVGNLFARKLYQKLGFREEGIRKNFYSHPTEDAVIMWI